MDERNKNVIDIYNAIAEEYAKQFDPMQSEEDLGFLNTFLSYLKSGNRIIDLGCGTGFSTNYFMENGMKAQGVDLSTKMIDIAKRNYPSLEFLLADMRDFVSEKDVDAVWAGYSLFHFEQEFLEKTLEQIKLYLNHGGILGLVIQRGSGEVDINEPFLPERKIYVHLYALEEITEILSRIGFRVIKSRVKEAKPFEFPYDKILIIAKLK